MTIGLGIPEGPPPTLAERRKTRQLFVGDVGVGSDHPISVQSMTTTKTHDVNATLQQIAQLATAGCDMVRVACPKTVDAEDRKSTRLNSSHVAISYAVFCLKKKKGNIVIWAESGCSVLCGLIGRFI